MTVRADAVSDICEVVSGPAFTSRDFKGPGEGIRLLRGENIEPGALRWTKTRTWPDGLLAGYEHLLVQPGDLILGMDRPIISAGLKLATARAEDLPALLVQRVARIRPLKVDGRYLSYWLSSPEFVSHLRRAATGTQLPHVTLRDIREFRVPRFGAEKEQRIVEILEDHLSRLDAADNGIATSARRLVAYQRSLRQQAVDAPGSPMVPLARMVSGVGAGRSLGGAAPPAGPDEWGVIKVSAMTWGEFRAHENKRIPADQADARYEILPGDLLVSRANTAAYVGASVLVGDVRSRLLLSDKSLRLVPRPGVNAKWLNEVLQSPRVRHQITALATGTKESMHNISQKALLSVSVPNSSEDEQAAVIDAIEKGVRSSRGMERALDAAERRSANLRRSLLAAAFSGRLTGRFSDLELADETSATVEPELVSVVGQKEAMLW
ncbi:hypothetical protein ACFT2C_05880 [Promicromonospora sp. NPDC057138]|uniref:restriction endonuclease subunit S n=1 Tax=Promicromonospora sp. NPDC057138 TaxID=3346031 RepID=UPI003630296C